MHAGFEVLYHSMYANVELVSALFVILDTNDACVLVVVLAQWMPESKQEMDS